MNDTENMEEHLKISMQKWFNVSCCSIRYQNKQLAECGDIVVKIVHPSQRHDAADFDTQPLIDETVEWKIPLERIKVFDSSVALYVKRESVFRCFIKKCVEGQFCCDNERPKEVYIKSDVDETCSDNFNMTEFRLSVVHKVVRNLMEFGGFKVLDHPTEGHSLVIHITKNRHEKSTGTELLCGPVTSFGISATDYVKKRSNDMQLIAQHKYGIRVRNHQRFQETVSSLGRSAAMVDMLESKTSSPIDMRKEKNQSSKGAAYILYNYARLSVLFKTFAEKQKTGYYPELPSVENIDFSLLREEDEWHLFWVYVVGFPNLLKQSMGDGQLARLSPHLVLSFTSGLVICLSKYYRRVRILTVRLPPEVNRVLYVRNLPYKITSDEMYDIFGKYGAIRQIRVGNTPETRGTAFVVYEDIFDAKNACDHLSGFNVCNRYLVVLYYQSTKAFKRLDVDKKQEELDQMKAKYNINSDDLRK